MAHDAHRQLSSRHPGVLLAYGEKRANAGLAGELELDGYVVRRASHPATLRERCTPGEVDLVIFGKSPHRGSDVLRALRGGELAPGAAGIRVLWLSASREPAAMSVPRAFEAGADDVARTSQAVQDRAVLYFRLDADRRMLLASLLASSIIGDLVTLVARLQARPVPSVVMIDEFSAVAAEQVARLFGRARSAGVSLILGTQ